MITLCLNKVHEFKRGEVVTLRVSNIYEQTPGKWRLEAKVSAKELPVMLLTSEAALMLGIHANTIRRWAEEGTLKSFRLGARGDRRFLREDLETLGKAKL